MNAAESTRPYRQSARAAAAARTAERILDAAVEAFWEEPARRLSLDEVARRAGVATQTVIRRFGGRDGLMAAAAEREQARVAEHRDAAPSGDHAAAVAVLVDHYEEYGDRVLRLLAEEHRSPAVAEVAAGGRAYHERWCERVFAAALEQAPADRRVRLRAQLVAACDVYTWKVLRRDLRLDRRDAEAAIAEAVEALVGAAR